MAGFDDERPAGCWLLNLIQGFSTSRDCEAALVSVPSPVVEIDVPISSEPRIFEFGFEKSDSRSAAQFWWTSPVTTIGLAMLRVSM